MPAGPRIGMLLDVNRVLNGAPAMSPTPPSTAAPATTQPHSPAPMARLCRLGDAWILEYRGHGSIVRHLKGVEDLTALLRAPGTEVHCTQLMGGALVQGDVGPLVDDRARRAYQQRVRTLQADIAEAHDRGHAAAAARAEDELDALVNQLSEAFGLGGRTRRPSCTAERARTAVTARTHAAIRRISDVHRDLGRHLDNAVRTGTWCSYRPDVEIAWQVEG